MSEAYEVRQTKFGYAVQTDFDVRKLDGDNFIEVTCEPFDINPDVQQYDLPAFHGSRDATEQEAFRTTSGSGAMFTMTGPVDLNDIDQFLYAHFQKVVEAVDTEYTKTFTYFTDHPAFSSDEGHFLTWIKRFPAANTSQAVGGCICNRIKFSGERDGYISFDTDWKGYGTTEDDANPSGTWTPRDGSDIVYFNDIETVTLTHGSGLTSPTAVILRSFEIEISYEVEKLGHDTTYGFEDWGFKNRDGSWSVNVLRDTIVDEAFASWKAGELIELEIDAGLITFTVSGKIENIEYDTEGLLTSTISCRMLAKNVGGSVSDPITIVVENSINRGW